MCEGSAEDIKYEYNAFIKFIEEAAILTIKIGLDGEFQTTSEYYLHLKDQTKDHRTGEIEYRYSDEPHKYHYDARFFFTLMTVNGKFSSAYLKWNSMDAHFENIKCTLID